MRADRLVSLLLLLQRRQRVTAAQAAAELEVSERTARRDLEALSAAGIPVYSERGRGGGWRLLGGGRTDLSGLNAAEARALFLIAGPSAAATPELRSALRKLVRALPGPLQNAAEASARSVLLDPGEWGQTRHLSRPDYLEVLQAAVVDAKQVRLGYRDRAGKSTFRIVHPLGTVQKGTTWYLVADTDEGLRTFRIGRVQSVEPTDDEVVRPEGFDLADTWKDIVLGVDELRSPVTVELCADPGLLDVLSWMFENRVVVGGAGPDGRIALTVRGPQIEILVAQLAGFGERVEVVSPPEARRRLRRLATELDRLYEAEPMPAGQQ